MLNNYRKNITGIPISIDQHSNEEICEPRGELEKYWIRDNNIDKLVKFGNETFDDQDLIELLMCYFYKLIGVPCMNVELGYLVENNKKRNCCLAEDIVKKSQGNEMITIKGAFYSYEDLLSYSMRPSESFFVMMKVFKNLHGISEHDFIEIRQDYIEMLFCDFLFDNFDRHLLNLAVIHNSLNNKYCFAPLFDNGACFSSYADNFEKYNIGFIQYSKDIYIQFLVDNFRDLLKPLINKVNLILSKENIEKVINLACFNELDINKKAYITDKIIKNNELVNELITSHEFSNKKKL